MVLFDFRVAIVCAFLPLLALAATSLQADKIVDPRVLEEECNLPEDVIKEIADYANVTNMIIEHITNGPFKGKTWQYLASFVDKFGNRLAGSQALEDAINYMVDLLKKQGLEEVHTENVEVPHWVRGQESIKLLEPRVKTLPMLGLGGSVATPPDGITASTVVVKSFEELRSLPNATVNGKIVVYVEEFKTYGTTVRYRTIGASEAAKKGAVAALVRTIAPFSIASPHTGQQHYEDGITKIPVAAITIEDADELLRMYKSGYNITIQLKMPATTDIRVSRNTIAELTGSTLQNKIVIVSGHLDSWDVGEGAMDDGGGAFISWVAPVILKNLGLRPKRTLRAILWTAEEQGLIGAEAYEKAHRKDNDNLNLVMESDFGTFSPLGIAYSGSKTGKCMVAEVLKLFHSINATQLALDDEPGPDISFFTKKGVPGGGLLNANEKYFWYHHSAGDTMNVLDPDVLDRCAAFWTAFSYVIADLSYNIPRE